MVSPHQESGLESGRAVGRGGPGVRQSEPRIVVPLDGSEAAMAALPVARTLAEIGGATVHLLYVSERQLPLREVSGLLGLSPQQLDGVVLEEVIGEPGDRILEFSCLPETTVVMTTHSAGPGAEHGLGPVTGQVLGSAGCPIVLVHPERGFGPWRLQRMLLPHDGSPVTAAGFRPAVRLAEKAEAAVFVLHVATLTGEPTPGSLPVPRYVDQPQHEWPEWTREFLERMDVFTEVSAGLPPRLLLSKGEPGEEILRFAAARSIDLIALSWHGTLEPRHAGTLKRVLDHAPCPIFFAKAPEEEPPARKSAGTIDLRESGPYLNS
jgi:nucleotide-binding universal stress UspA family protein